MFFATVNNNEFKLSKFCGVFVISQKMSIILSNRGCFY